MWLEQRQRVLEARVVALAGSRRLKLWIDGGHYGRFNCPPRIVSQRDERCAMLSPCRVHMRGIEWRAIAVDLHVPVFHEFAIDHERGEAHRAAALPADKHRLDGEIHTAARHHADQ